MAGFRLCDASTLTAAAPFGNLHPIHYSLSRHGQAAEHSTGSIELKQLYARAECLSMGCPAIGFYLRDIFLAKEGRRK